MHLDDLTWEADGRALRARDDRGSEKMRFVASWGSAVLGNRDAQLLAAELNAMRRVRGLLEVLEGPGWMDLGSDEAGRMLREAIEGGDNG